MFPTVFWRWRWATLVLFGGIHGLAFAHSMILGSDMALSPLAALFGFNFGVGVGQLLVISAAFLLAAPFWQRAWYRPRVVLPALSLIALVGLGWALARI